ncbi:MAG: importin-alpha export receptor [Vezdaea aestivalis]|nr:MAG: importin-alpha export receptor [Vezdaea aestivalis]
MEIFGSDVMQATVQILKNSKHHHNQSYTALDLMAADIPTVAPLLLATLDPRQNKQAELDLREIEKLPGYSIILLEIIAAPAQQETTRLASALCFKNFVRRCYNDENGQHLLPDDEVNVIKTQLLNLMVSSPPRIQAQLGDAISVIAQCDFYDRWQNLVGDIVSRFSTDNTVTNTGVLQVAHSIFKRWRPLFKSDELYTEINHVLGTFSTPFLSLLETTDQRVEADKGKKESLLQLFTTLEVMMQLVFDLSCQDIPPEFETNLQAVSGVLLKYLAYNNPLLETDDDSEVGVLELVKADIFEVLILYTTRYEDDFGPLLESFIQSGWNMLTNIGPETKYDILVSKALQFLTAVCGNAGHAQSFNNESVLESIVEKVIIPNLSLRESDIEMFEDEPIEFIRRDLEGSDNDTRRRAATDFLRKLRDHFNELVTRVVMKYVHLFLAEYVKDTEGKWRSKDTAVYLFSSIAATGIATSTQGVVSMNPLVDIVEFFQTNIASDLLAESTVQTILKVDAIKYLYTFRSHLTKEQWHSAFPLLVANLNSPHYVVYTYASISVERAMFLTNASHEPIFSKSDIQGSATNLLQHLFTLIQKDTEPEKVQENEFLMRCAMRVLIVIKDGVLEVVDSVLPQVVNITTVISKNPSNPRFYYYHFEAVAALIRWGSPTQPDKFEQTLYEPFSEILRNDIQEFVPYVFQLFAALLEANPAGTISDYYRTIIPPILQPVLWETKANVPALVRLLSSFIARDAAQMVVNNQIEPVLGIFQKLVSSKVTEAAGFELLEVVVGTFPFDALKPYFSQILQLVMMRLQGSKTDQLGLRFTHFFHFCSMRAGQGLGTDVFVEQTEALQPNLFPELYLGILLPTTPTLTRPLDRKLAALSELTTLLTSQAFNTRYLKGWGKTLLSLLSLLSDAPRLQHTTDYIVLEHDVDDLSFGQGFTQLSVLKRPGKDWVEHVRDVPAWVRGQVAEAKAKGVDLEKLAAERLPPVVTGQEELQKALGQVGGLVA